MYKRIPTAMTDETYRGYPNWETWNAALTVDNREWFNELAIPEDGACTPIAESYLIRSLDRIEWREIAQSWLSERLESNTKPNVPDHALS